MKIITKILQILSIQNCLLCRQSAEDIVCNYCLHNLEEDLNTQQYKLDFDIEYDYYHLLSYTTEVRYLLQKFKFQKDLLVMQVFSKLMQKWWDKMVDKYFADVDAIAVVPIHRFRYIYRGFNQSELIASKLAEYADIKIVFSNYSRIKYTKSQAKSSKQKRASQIKGVFQLNQPIIAKHLLIFDDVLTTGATIREFIETISKDSQIDKISIVTLVRPD
ncbi:ComF family protein [Francisella philomiragia]|uniref:ComF family protein n=1 Tax=Francisella philomiragia TaxID=28110 RepID=UPI001908C6E4|nr:ComF family protein [Francisella philomiragia]MBK2268221.1 ComF family protein [Francisella philomiragia]MBK2279679.1 ComF family protein [Francisella philomiragia]MBK2287532.1 ComF family protein [Francisella philomiragia]MBK2289511.1 ComF family protein [Francisella philomiragia]MBK2291230.1 ComF family protein [Francisella philomiragia]